MQDSLGTWPLATLTWKMRLIVKNCGRLSNQAADALTLCAATLMFFDFPIRSFGTSDLLARKLQLWLAEPLLKSLPRYGLKFRPRMIKFVSTHTKKPNFGLLAVTNNNCYLKCLKCNEYKHNVWNCGILKINENLPLLHNINMNLHRWI